MNNQSPFIIVFTAEGKKPLIVRNRKGHANTEWTENPLAAMPFDTVEAAGRIAQRIHKEEFKPHAQPGYDGLRVMRVGSTTYDKLFPPGEAYAVFSINELSKLIDHARQDETNSVKCKEEGTATVVIYGKLWVDSKGEMQLSCPRPR